MDKGPPPSRAAEGRLRYQQDRDAGSASFPFESAALSLRQRPPSRLGDPHAVAILACDNPEAIVLDFMQPQVAGGQLVGLCGKARRDEADREGTLQHVG
jgi:hypothetical protein